MGTTNWCKIWICVVKYSTAWSRFENEVCSIKAPVENCSTSMILTCFHQEVRNTFPWRYHGTAPSLQALFNHTCARSWGEMPVSSYVVGQASSNMNFKCIVGGLFFVPVLFIIFSTKMQLKVSPWQHSSNLCFPLEVYLSEFLHPLSPRGLLPASHLLVH